MSEALKHSFQKSEYSKVEKKIEDAGLQNEYAKLKEDIGKNLEIMLMKLAEKSGNTVEKAEQTDETFEERFFEFKNFLVERKDKGVVGSLVDTALDKIEEEKKEHLDTAYKSVYEVVSKTGWMKGIPAFMLSWLGVEAFVKGKVDEKLGVETQDESEEEIGFMDKMVKGFMGSILGMFVGKKASDEASKYKDSFFAIGKKVIESGENLLDGAVDGITDLVGTEEGNDKKDKTEEKEKKEPYIKKVEEIELDPEAIYKNFNNQYIHLLIHNVGEEIKLGHTTIFTTIQGETFSVIKKKQSDTYEEETIFSTITSEDSSNLLTPFFSDNKYLLHILDSEYIQKNNIGTTEEISVLKKKIQDGSFDWKDDLTWFQITILVSQKFASFGQESLTEIKSILSSQSILDLDRKNIEKMKKMSDGLGEKGKKTVGILTDAYEERHKGKIEKLLTSDNSLSKENNKTVLKFTEKLLNSNMNNQIKSELNIDMNKVLNTFSILEMAKLYTLLDGNTDYSTWGSAEKITFLTWYPKQLLGLSNENDAANFTSEFVQSIMSDDGNGSFISEEMKSFFQTSFKILGKNTILSDVNGDLGAVQGIINSFLPESLEMNLKTDISNYSAKFLMFLGVIGTCYGTYRIGKFMYQNKGLIFLTLTGFFIAGKIKDKGELEKKLNNALNKLY